MKPRPKQLYRSLIFWSGILVMGSILWGWRDSMRMMSMMSSKGLLAMNFEGFVMVMREPLGPIAPTEISREDMSMGLPGKPPAFAHPCFARGGNLTMTPADFAASDQPESFQTYMLRGVKFRPPDTWAIFLPHWLLLLVIVLPWLGALAWRARRLRRAEAMLR